MKKDLNYIQAKIIAILSAVDNMKKNVKFLHRKLNVDYNYICRILRELHYKGYLIRDQRKGRRYVVYDLSVKAKRELPSILEIMENWERKNRKPKNQSLKSLE